MTPNVQTRPTATKVPATAPVLLKKADEPEEGLEEPLLMPGFRITWVSVMASPLAPVDVERRVMVGGAEVTVLPDASVVVTRMAEVASDSRMEAEGEGVAEPRLDVGGVVVLWSVSLRLQDKGRGGKPDAVGSPER